jgi:hypothetical protein
MNGLLDYFWVCLTILRIGVYYIFWGGLNVHCVIYRQPVTPSEYER